MRHLKHLALLTLGLSFLNGCATLLQNGPDRISVNTSPQGAKLYLDGQPIGYTPMIVSIPRKSEGILKFEKEGYETLTLDKDKVLAGWFIGDIILLSPLGLAIDLISSNQGKYSEDPIDVMLIKKNERGPSSVKNSSAKE